MCIFSGSPKILRSCASPDSQAEPRAWTANPQAMPWDQVCPAAWAKAPRMEPHSYPPQKKKETVSRMPKTVYFRWNQADCPDPNHDSNDHSEVTKKITRFLSILLSILTVLLLEIWPNAMPSCRKRSLMRYTMKLLEKSRGNKIIPTSAPQLGWTDIGREPRLWSNVYILSFVYTYIISFCL